MQFSLLLHFRGCSVLSGNVMRGVATFKSYCTATGVAKLHQMKIGGVLCSDGVGLWLF